MKPALGIIPVHDLGEQWALEGLAREPERLNALLDGAERLFTRPVMRIGDEISRRWLDRTGHPHAEEIAAVARTLGRPGGYFLNVNYEWGCSTWVGPAPERASARLVRVLDWPFHGIGRAVMAVRHCGSAWPFVSLTWPGFTGVLQAVAPGRFAAAINQAPMARTTWIMPVDWAINRTRVWRGSGETPVHLLRRVFETAPGFAAAKAMIAGTRLALPAIFVLSGIKAEEACVIEHRGFEARLIEAPNGTGAANHWTTAGWRGRPRGVASRRRQPMICAMGGRAARGGFDWLQ